MLTIHERATEAIAAAADGLAGLRLELPFELRSRSRLRAHLSNGEEVGVMLGRGQVLRGGDRLLASGGLIVEVIAAVESVSTVRAPDARALARAAYHLGNRHVALQIGEGWLRYSHDHVLDDMLRGLGLTVIAEQAAFEPEAGAYHAGDASAASVHPGAHHEADHAEHADHPHGTPGHSHSR